MINEEKIINEDDWRPIFIKGVKTIYEISSLGNIRSFFRGKWHTRKTYICKHTGYKRVTLKVNRVPFNSLVHRLIAIGFIENNNSDFDCINHINGNKLDNSISNLEWCDHLLNQRHAWQHGLHTKRYGVENHRSRRIGKYLSGTLIKGYNTLLETEQDGFSSSGVCGAAKRKGTHRGYHWNYI